MFPAFQKNKEEQKGGPGGNTADRGDASLKRKWTTQSPTPSSSSPGQEEVDMLADVLSDASRVQKTEELRRVLNPTDTEGGEKKKHKPLSQHGLMEEELTTRPGGGTVETEHLTPLANVAASKAPLKTSPAPYGPYTVGERRPFWQEPEQSEAALSERLKSTTKLIKEGLDKDRLAPEFWDRVVELLYPEQETTGVSALTEPGGEVPEEEGELERPSKKKASTQPLPAKRTRAASTQKLTGAAAGADFVANYVAQPIAGSSPTIEETDFESEYTPKKLPEVSKPGEEPGYILNMPAYVDKLVGPILKKYGDEATRGAPDLPARMAAVVGINMRVPLDDADRSNVEKAVNQAASGDANFRYGVFGFFWAPQFSKAGGPKIDIDEVKKAYNALGDDSEAKKHVRENLYKSHSGQTDIAYGLFRQQVADHALVDKYQSELAEVSDPVYLHIADPDAVSWVVNNDKNVGILARYDEVIGEMSKRAPEAPRPPMIIGGYNFGAPTTEDSPIKELCKVGNVLDRAIRRSIAAIAPEVVYPTEPNLLVKVLDKREVLRAQQWTKTKNPFGKGGAEGNKLGNVLSKMLNRKRSEQTFAPYVDETIETDIPARVIQSAGAHPKEVLLNLIKQKQSYATTETWTAITRTVKEKKGKGKDPDSVLEVKAKQWVNDELRKIIEDYVTAALKRRAERQLSPEPTLGGMEEGGGGGFGLGSSAARPSRPTGGTFEPGTGSGESSKQTPPFASGLWKTYKKEEDFDDVQMQVVMQSSFEDSVGQSGLLKYVTVENASGAGNNCLIYSIAGAAGKDPSEEQIREIRNHLNAGSDYLNTNAIPIILKVLGVVTEVVVIDTTQPSKDDGWFPAEVIYPEAGGTIYIVNANNIHFGWVTGLKPGVKVGKVGETEGSGEKEKTDTGIRFSAPMM